MEKPITLAFVVQSLQALLDDLSRTISEKKDSLDELEMKSALTEKEAQKCEQLRFDIEALEVKEEAFDNALSLLVDFVGR